jgi:NAD+ synthase
MLLLYNYANSKNALVAGTGNLSELSVGYFTKFGDGACDFMPLADLTKTKVIALAKHKKLPKEILKKAPSAELWPGQTDEAELNITYKALDQMIEGVISGNFVQKQLLNNPRQSSKKLKWLHARFFATQHKRSMPTIISAHALM